MWKKYLLLITLFIISSYAKSVKNIDESVLVQMIKGENPTIVLFTKNNCEKCQKYEKIVENLQNDLGTTLNADVVKINNSPMVSLYDPTKEPSLIMFRRGIPLLYHGNVNEDEISMYFSENRDPVVKELSDKNFEHLTQATTGATTCDWFIFFTSQDCVQCQRLSAIWEAVAANLRRRTNVAIINRKEFGVVTAKRFLVEKSPDFVFIRQGKYYRYNSEIYTPQALIKFAEGDYTKVPEQTIPLVLDAMSFFLIQFTYDHPILIIYGIIVMGIALFAIHCAPLFKKKNVEKDKKAK